MLVPCPLKMYVEIHVYMLKYLSSRLLQKWKNRNPRRKERGNSISYKALTQINEMVIMISGKVKFLG